MSPALAIAVGVASISLFLISVAMGTRVPFSVVVAGFVLAISSIVVNVLYLFGVR